jgi:hypothetical protein
MTVATNKHITSPITKIIATIKAEYLKNMIILLIDFKRTYLQLTGCWWGELLWLHAPL